MIDRFHWKLTVKIWFSVAIYFTQALVLYFSVRFDTQSMTATVNTHHHVDHKITRFNITAWFQHGNGERCYVVLCCGCFSSAQKKTKHQNNELHRRPTYHKETSNQKAVNNVNVAEKIYIIYIHSFKWEATRREKLTVNSIYLLLVTPQLTPKIKIKNNKQQPRMEWRWEKTRLLNQETSE